MPQATRDIKRRIKSVTNTKKVTKAMQMVAAAKMRKAVANVLASRSYAVLAWELVKKLAERTNAKYHPLLKQRQFVKKVGLVLITSNRGLCGGFNNSIINTAIKFVRQQQADTAAQADVVVLGKKGRDVMIKSGQNIIADFEKLDVTTAIEEIRPMVKLLISDYLTGKLDNVIIAYTDFISTLVQKPRILQLLPLQSQEEDKYLGQARHDQAEVQQPMAEAEYLFEPTADKVLRDLLPRMLETQMYQAILESDASEHSSRMVAMQNATDAAKDMINDLTLIFNKARQGSITAELADISGGRAALE